MLILHRNKTVGNKVNCTSNWSRRSVLELHMQYLLSFSVFV